MDADFSGYVTKAGLKCADGRTILPNAFAHQDKIEVPLVWQHGHTNIENVLGHMVLENREDGVYGYGFFNDTDAGKHAAKAVKNKDIKHMSIWANELIERFKQVSHGVIREVSLVLSGANPGALIDAVAIRHSDGSTEEVDGEAIIHTGLEFEKVDGEDHVEHADGDAGKSDDGGSDDKSDDDKTVGEIYEGMSTEQKSVVHYLVDQALQEGGDDKGDDDKDKGGDSAQHSATGSADSTGDNTDHAAHSNKEGGAMPGTNVFEQDQDKDDKGAAQHVLSHSAMNGIMADATKNGSLKEAVEGYALQHGIEDIDILFPEARTLSTSPEFLSRRMEWVNNLLGKCHKSPFSRIKTIHADITEDEARAKGYITGNLKREEFFGLAKRVTTPTTVYKKQKLDRDDMVDITDFDVVAWLKGEMRIMLDEEIARAILIGDGRDPSNEDKINEQCIRPIAKDHELYAPTIYVNIDDANSNMNEVIDALTLNRAMWKGTGLPTFYTTEYYVAKFLTHRDTLGRRLYKNLDEVATELRVSEIVPVEVMEEEPSIVGILVNPADYNIGADKGGNVAMFDDFDIDYNQYKYLIETRISGALTKLKSAIVVRKTAGSSVLATPVEPTFDQATGALTIPTVTGVVYKKGDGTTVNAAGSPYTVADGTSLVINATPASGYYFATTDDDSWEFTNPA